MMKSPEEYLDKYNVEGMREILGYIIKQAQLDTYNKALDDAVENATTASYKLSKYSKTPRWKRVKDDEEVDLFSYDFTTKVDKQSILKLKK